MKERLELFCKKHKPDLKLGPLRDDLLTHTHWYHLGRIQDCLNLFHVATLEIEGNGAFFYDRFPQDPTFATLSDAARHAWLKCEKYYKLADDTSFSYAAVILNPTMKKQWFVDRWSSDTTEQRSWIPQVKEQVRQHWLCFYKHTGTAKTLQPPNQARVSLPASSDDLRERLRVYKRVKLDHEASSDGIDDFEEYLRTDLIPCDATFDPVEYWLSRCQAKPQLAKFALDCLAIPPMSDACKRSFSSGIDLIHYKRSRLLCDVIEACTCLRNWYGKPAPRKVKTKGVVKHGETVVVEHEFDVFDDEERVEDAYGNV